MTCPISQTLINKQNSMYLYIFTNNNILLIKDKNRQGRMKEKVNNHNKFNISKKIK